MTSNPKRLGLSPVADPAESEQPGAVAQDHRVRVGAQRREKTRLRLLESALNVFTDKGPDLAVIEDVIAAAGVSRGTFYNHFRTTSELLLALTVSMSDEALATIDPLVVEFDDPVRRFATGTRLYMQMALRYPLWGSFLTRVGTRTAARGQIDHLLSRDLNAALKNHRIEAGNLLVARDIVLGSIFYGIETMLTEPTHDHHPELIVCNVLIGLGVEPTEAKTIAFMPLPTPGAPQGPIFSRLQSRQAPTSRKKRSLA